ncbi:hypothetical protein I2492_06825 [Budviciaceae bacterium CWB-B4]|uniref:HNH endonuclease n=1 Tax=Limnobaculum xujianqingii TaxID=2738837 RepID=A0A9D7AHH3_9GAMM|nr:HNH endonuclease domain-containing protein [Limnobaculum xujianqingii]MBK5072725.1 hypothetical protein [Limnobaculum xujianqingii]MBK5176034.1 hypothetical protein [Limnobaculum xujianqingii]
MADILLPINFDKGHMEKIEKIISKAGFNHNDWGCDELIEIRRHIRNYYRKTQKGLCIYCRKQVSMISSSNCHIEHISPKSIHINFIFEPKNLCVICADCNQVKNDKETIINTKNRKKYPRSSNAFLIYHPHFDNYEEHIQIFNKQFYIGKSNKGDFTIAYCQLNRYMRNFGWHEGNNLNTELLDVANKILKIRVADPDKHAVIMDILKDV